MFGVPPLTSAWLAKRLALLALRAMVSLFVLLTPCASRATAQQLDPSVLSRESFVKLTVSNSPILEKGKTESGSGVLVSRDGHILTAAHVVAAAVDEIAIDHDVSPRPPARIVAQFVNDLEQLEEMEYEASVSYYSAPSDIALLRIDVPPHVIANRHVPTLDPLSAHVTCAWCFTILGHTSRGFESVLASPGQAVQGNYMRMLTSNMTRGYSGGPVFYKSLSEWHLVGIAISGDRVRQATNFMVTIHAADGALGPIRDSLSYLDRSVFPSEKFKDWARITFSPVDEAMLKAFVEREIKKNPDKFVKMVLDEDLQSVAHENKSMANTAKMMLEISLQAMFKERDRVDSTHFSLLVDKLVTLYRYLGVEPRFSVIRRREDALVQLAKCDRLSRSRDDSGLHRCWQRLDDKQLYIVVRAIRPNYIQALSSFRERQQETGSLVQWSIMQLEQLVEWGDFLSRVGSDPRIASLEQAIRTFRPAFLARLRAPSETHPESPRIPFRAAAVDKYDEARDILIVPERYQTLKKSFPGIGDFRSKVCAAIKREIKALRSLLGGGNGYKLLLEKKLVTEIDPYCP